MPQIRVKNGQQKGKVIPVEGGDAIVIGRDPSCNLQITDRGVSREHAKIFRVGEMIFIRDLSSRNGSFVNDEKIKEELLREGDVLRVGNTQLVFESRKSALRGKDIQYEDGESMKTSLELKVGDLYVADSSSPMRESEHFKAICQVTQIVQGERDEKKLFEKLLDLIQEYIPADYVYLFVRDESTGAVTPSAMRQKGTGTVPISRSILKRVIADSKAILTADAMKDDRFKGGDSVVINKIRSVLCVPVQGSSHAVGAIYALNSSISDTFDQSDVQLLSTLGSQLALALESLSQLRTRRRMYLKTIGRLVSLLEGQKTPQPGHSERVGNYAGAMAVEMGLSDFEALSVTMGALLHDVGKSLVDSSANAEAHVLAGIAHLQGIEGLDSALNGISCHQERFDGSGVPHQLKEQTIPLSGRIIAVASDFDRRLYGPGRDPGNTQFDASAIRQAFAELDAQSGILYDPDVVRALMVAYRHNALDIPREHPVLTTEPTTTLDPSQTGFEPAVTDMNGDERKYSTGRVAAVKDSGKLTETGKQPLPE